MTVGPKLIQNTAKIMTTKAKEPNSNSLIQEKEPLLLREFLFLLNFLNVMTSPKMASTLWDYEGLRSFFWRSLNRVFYPQT